MYRPEVTNGKARPLSVFLLTVVLVDRICIIVSGAYSSRFEARLQTCEMQVDVNEHSEAIAIEHRTKWQQKKPSGSLTAGPSRCPTQRMAGLTT
jgi:hypothetical protein